MVCSLYNGFKVQTRIRQQHTHITQSPAYGRITQENQAKCSAFTIRTQSKIFSDKFPKEFQTDESL